MMRISFDRYLALLFIVAVMAITWPPAVTAQTTSDTLSANEGVLYFNVTDKHGRFVTNLLKENFKIEDDDVEWEITSFKFEEAPVSVGFLIDTSRSAEYLTEYSFDSLPLFMKECADGSDFFVMSFADEPRLLVDWRSTSAEVLKELRGLTIKTQGGTGLFDSIDHAISKVAGGKSSRKALIVFSDGFDTVSKLRSKDLGGRLGATDVALYNIGIGRNYSSSGMTDAQAVQSMSELAGMSGGRVLRPDMGRFDESVMRIAAELRYQYRIGFRPAAIPAGKQVGDRRRIAVKVVPPPDMAKKVGKLSVHRRNGYRVDPSNTK